MRSWIPPRLVKTATRPRSRAEADVALHSVGLVLDDLFFGTRLPNKPERGDLRATAPELPVLDVQSFLSELFVNAAVDAAPPA